MTNITLPPDVVALLALADSDVVDPEKLVDELAEALVRAIRERDEARRALASTVECRDVLSERCDELKQQRNEAEGLAAAMREALVNIRESYELTDINATEVDAALSGATPPRYATPDVPDLVESEGGHYHAAPCYDPECEHPRIDAALSQVGGAT